MHRPATILERVRRPSVPQNAFEREGTPHAKDKRTNAAVRRIEAQQQCTPAPRRYAGVTRTAEHFEADTKDRSRSHADR